MKQETSSVLQLNYVIDELLGQSIQVMDHQGMRNTNQCECTPAIQYF
jgi:hypothetical protein